MEHVGRIGFLVGPHAQFSNLKNYEKIIVEIVGYEVNKFEVRKSFNI